MIFAVWGTNGHPKMRLGETRSHICKDNPFVAFVLFVVKIN